MAQKTEAQLNKEKYGHTQRPAPTADDRGRSGSGDLRNGQIEQGSPALPGENDYNSDDVKYGKPEPRNQPGSADTSRDIQRRENIRAELQAETATQSQPVAEYRAGSGNPDYPTNGKVSNEAEKVGNDRTGSGRSGHSDTGQPGESSDDSRLAQGGDNVADSIAENVPQEDESPHVARNNVVSIKSAKSLKSTSATRGIRSSPHVASGRWQVDYVRASENTYAFRLRWAEGKKRGTPIYVSRVSATVFRMIRKGNYEAFKQQLISNSTSTISANKQAG